MLSAPQEATADELASLAKQLAGGPEAVSEALRERLGAWLVAGRDDPALVEALARISDNPLQAGFNLLTGGGD